MHTVTLHKAIYNENISQVRSLIADGQALNTPIGTNGFYPLQHAVFLGLYNIAKLLLNKGADVNQLSGSDDNNESALHLAVKPLKEIHTAKNKRNKLLCLNLLLEQKPEVLNHCDIDGYSALSLAIYHDFQEAALCLLKAKATATKTHPLASIAAMRGHLSCLKWVLSLRPDNSGAIEPSTGRTALHHAAKNNNLTCLRLLLQHNPALLKKSKKNGTAFLLVLSKFAGKEAIACELFNAYLTSAKTYRGIFNTREITALRKLTDAQKLQLEMGYAPIIAPILSKIRLTDLIPVITGLIAEYAAPRIDELAPPPKSTRSMRHLLPWR